jgi:hypothetical protein
VARDAQPVRDEGPDLLVRQALEPVADRDALGDLAQRGVAELRLQLRLTDQDDLEELLRGGFQVRDQPKAVEKRRVRLLVDPVAVEKRGSGVA